MAIGQNFEASVLTTLNLRQANVPYVVAKARSPQQVRVLELTGAHQVVFPEQEAGELAAYRLVNRRRLDFLRLDARTSVAAAEVGTWVGRRLRDVERESGLTALGVYRGGRLLAVAQSDPLAREDRLVLAGANAALQEFARER